MDGAPACPFVAYVDDRDGRSTSPDHRHRCFAESPPAPRAVAHQEAYCLSSAFPVCPVFQEWARREAAQARGQGSASDDAAGAEEPRERPVPPVPRSGRCRCWRGRRILRVGRARWIRRSDRDPTARATRAAQSTSRLGRTATLGDRGARRRGRRARRPGTLRLHGPPRARASRGAPRTSSPAVRRRPDPRPHGRHRRPGQRRRAPTMTWPVS
jgi:hypothetical protein